MKAQRMKSTGRNQDRKLLDQLQRIQQQMSRAIRPRMRQLEHHLPVRALCQPLQRQRRAQEVATQVLQPLPRVRRHRHVRVKGKPVRARAPRLRSVHHRGRRPEPAHGMPRPQTAGHESLDRGRGVLGQQRHLLGHRIARGRFLLGPTTPSAQQTPYATVDLVEYFRHLGVGRRRQRLEDRGPRRRRSCEDTVEHDRVEVDV